MSEELSLPPLIKDDIQGRLDMIILRPSLTPSLHSEQILEFRYCWWGSEYTHKIRLYPGCDDIRIVYDVRCDLKGLQRYFIDAEYLTVELSVVSDTESDLQQSSHEHQVRKKKEWKAGDFIGKFSLSGLKLNARGEYIKECNIHNSYDDHLGSVMTFILYTPGSQLVSAPKQTKVCRKEIQTAKISSKIKENAIHPQPTQITPKKNKVLSKENHSPRISSCKNNSVRFNFSPQKISKPSQKLKESVKSSPLNVKDLTLRNNDDENSNILSSLSFPNKEHILNRLFSFVDSGVLQLSDLPTLIQICQGRSPSLDLDSYEQIDDQIKSIDDYEDETKEAVFNEEFRNSLSSNTDQDPAKLLDYYSPTCAPTDLKNKLEDKSINSEPSDEESSLLVLLFHSVQLNDQLQMKDVNQKKKKIVVRQRSKICYFVEIVLEFEDVENLQSTLLVSRQITETQEILFNSKKIFSLENGRDDGYLKFKVASRQMGNQKPDTVGIGIVSLNQIRSKKGSENSVTIPLWASNESSNDIKSYNRSSEKPVGYLIFSVAFAMSGVSSHCDVEENRLQTDKCNNSSYSNDIQINDNFKTLQSGYKILEKDIIPPEKPLQDFENITSQESLIIEASSNVKYIPVKNMDADSLKEVHLEILEGNGLPLLRSKRTHASLQPNSYILTTIPQFYDQPTTNFTFNTKIIKSSSSPVWNDRTNFTFRREDLEHTNYKLILKLFHSLDGESTQSDDPFLGFAPIDINFLWNSFLSLCGWIPLLDLDGNVCGEIKVSLTPKKSVCSYMEKSKNSDGRVFDEPRKTCKHVNFTTHDKNSECKESNINSRIYPGEFLPNCRSRNQLTKTYSVASENISGPPHDKLMKYNNYESPSVILNVDEEVKVEEPIVDFNEITKVRTEERYNPVVIEAMQWMNHVDPLDSPYVSYLDMYSNEKPIKVTNKKAPNCKRRSRIAANLNFLHDR